MPIENFDYSACLSHGTDRQESSFTLQDCKMNDETKSNGFELFTLKREKNVFNSLFGNINSDSGEDDNSDIEDNGTTIAENDVTSSIVENILGKEDSRCTYSFSGLNLIICENKSRGIAHQIWPAAKLFCEYIDNNNEILFSKDATNVNILELGAGLGLCSIFLSGLFSKRENVRAHVIMTDLPEAIEGMNKNISLNSNLEFSNVILESAILCWGNRDHLHACLSRFESCPIVIATDCIYWTSLFQPFLATVHELCEAGTVVIVTHVKRWKKDAIFFSMCRKKGLSVDILKESIEWIKDEHTNILKKQISRIYKISKIGQTERCSESDV